MFLKNRKWTALLPRWCTQQITLVGMCPNWGLWVVFCCVCVCVCVCVFDICREEVKCLCVRQDIFHLNHTLLKRHSSSFGMNQLVMGQITKGKMNLTRSFAQCCSLWFKWSDDSNYIIYRLQQKHTSIKAYTFSLHNVLVLRCWRIWWQRLTQIAVERCHYRNGWRGEWITSRYWFYWDWR